MRVDATGGVCHPQRRDLAQINGGVDLRRPMERELQPANATDSVYEVLYSQAVWIEAIFDPNMNTDIHQSHVSSKINPGKQHMHADLSLPIHV